MTVTLISLLGIIFFEDTKWYVENPQGVIIIQNGKFIHNIYHLLLALLNILILIFMLIPRISL